MASEDRLRELEDKYEDYKVYDNQGSKIGKVDDLFIDESDNEEYIGVKLGLFGMRSTLIPMDIVRVNETNRTIEVSESKDRVKDAPNFDDDDDITTEYEERIRSHFGLETHSSSRGSYGASSASSSETAAAGAATGTAAGSSTEDTAEHERAEGEETRTSERSAAGSDAEYRSSEETQSADTREHGAESTSATDAASRTGDDEYTSGSGREASSGGGSGVTEDRDAGSSHESGSEGARLGEGATPGTPVSRQTEETETFEEGGRTKIRRRIVREEVEDADQDTGHSQ